MCDQIAMSKLRVGSRGSQLALRQANHVSALLRSRGREWARRVRTIMERHFSHFDRIRKICSCDGSTLALLKWGFGEYYQCGY